MEKRAKQERTKPPVESMTLAALRKISKEFATQEDQLRLRRVWNGNLYRAEAIKWCQEQLDKVIGEVAQLERPLGAAGVATESPQAAGRQPLSTAMAVLSERMQQLEALHPQEEETDHAH